MSAEGSVEERPFDRSLTEKEGQRLHAKTDLEHVDVAHIGRHVLHATIDDRPGMEAKVSASRHVFITAGVAHMVVLPLLVRGKGQGVSAGLRQSLKRHLPGTNLLLKHLQIPNALPNLCWSRTRSGCETAKGKLLIVW